MAKDKALFMRHWFDKAEKRCSEEQFKEVCYATIKYLLYEEEVELEDTTAGMAFDFIKDQADLMQGKYEEKVQYGKTVGRKGTFNEEENIQIYELACAGHKVNEIADIMGITDERKKKAIYNSNGWKNRKKN